MLRISVHIPEETKKRINFIAQSESKPKAEIIREAIDEGLKAIHPKMGSNEGLMKFIKMAEKIPTKGKLPKDLIKNLDYYTWGGEKRE